MTWEPCLLPGKAWTPRKYEACAISIAANRLNRRALSLPCALLKPSWAAGERLTIADGAGEHHGLLRLVLDPLGDCRLFLQGRARTVDRPALMSLFVPLPAGLQPCMARPRSYIQHRWHGDALILGPLPDWACPALSHGHPPPANPGGHGPLKNQSGLPRAAALTDLAANPLGPLPSPLPPRERSDRPQAGPGEGGKSIMDGAPPKPGRTINVTDQVIPRR